MEKYVLVYGGKSPENEISVLTALKVYEEMKKNGNEPYLVYIDTENNFYSGSKLKDNKNYPSKKGFRKIKFIKRKKDNYIVVNHKKYLFNYVYILGHGIGSEDGTISSYFEMNNIPYLYDDLYNASLLQDKQKSKMVFEHFSIPVIKSEIIYRHQFNDFNPKKIGISYPLIIKPNRLGSSIGVSTVHGKKELKSAIFEALKYDESVLIEECIIEKEEYNIAIAGYQDKTFLSSIEKVNDNKEILDFFDKYDYSNRNNKRVIDPMIDEETEKKIREYSKIIFDELNLCGIYRFDFILSKKDNVLFLNEVNVLPGSMAYYLFESKNVKFIDLLIMDITFKKKKYEERNERIKEYEPNYISNVDLAKLVK